MARILGVLPSKFRISKRVWKTLISFSNKAKNINQNIKDAANIKQQLEASIFERQNNIQRSIETAKYIKGNI